MIEFESKLFFDESVCKLFNKRQYNKSFKKALQFAMARWHKVILKTHFTRTAYGKYPRVYKNQKKKGRPMVKKGSLSRSVLNSIDIRGTATKVKGKVTFGRPNPMTKDEVYDRAWIIATHQNMEFKAALASAQRAMGNYAQHRDLFELQIKAMSDKDLQRIHRWVKEFMLKEFKTVGRKRKIKKVTKNGCL